MLRNYEMNVLSHSVAVGLSPVWAKKQSCSIYHSLISNLIRLNITSHMTPPFILRSTYGIVPTLSTNLAPIIWDVHSRGTYMYSDS